MKKIISICITILLLSWLPAFAMELQDAKDQGLVGETTTGYLEAVNTPTSEVRALIEEINRKRKDQYQKIAEKNRTPLATVESMAGDKAIEKSKAGHYVKQGGEWRKK
ncbi:MAG: YdbL family protein [Desulfobulbaceae bacterium]|nr:YdbL family protein [Desulfobulbaceae bacterium]